MYLSRSDFRILENGDLEGLYPNPNSDGIDPDGSSGLSYQWSLEKNGTTVAGPTAVAGDSWPAAATIAADQVPEYPFFIEVARVAGDQSASVKILAPRAGQTDPGVLRAYRRWLIHVPRQAGGFDGRLRFTNHHPSRTAQVLCVGFSLSGQRLVEEVVSVAPSSEGTRTLYAQGDSGIFASPEFLDQVSHIAVWEDQPLARVSLEYVSRASGFGVWTDEYDFDVEPVVGARFRLSGGAPNENYWDGMAIANLTSGVAAEVRIRRFAADGSAAGEVSLGTLLPGEKRLSVVNFEFDDFLPRATFEIEALGATGAESIQILGLSGILSGEFFGPARTIRLP